jgi:transcriptional regulator with XRE-family HTH domain
MTPIPHEPVNRAEIARRFGVTRPAVSEWTRKSTFPAPVTAIAGMAIYDWVDVLEWVRTERRRTPLAS